MFRDYGSSRVQRLDRVVFRDTTMSRLSDTIAPPNLCLLLQETYDSSEQLSKAMQRLRNVRKRTIVQLYSIIEELDTHHFNVNISKVVGSSVGLTGGVLSVLGLVLVPVSLGASLGLTIVGSGMAAAGGLTATGAGIAEKVISKIELPKAQAAIDADRALVEEVKRRWQSFERSSERIMMAIEYERACKEHSATTMTVLKKLKAAWSMFSEKFESKHAESAIFLWSIISFGKSAVRLVSSAWDVLQVLYLGSETFASKIGWVERIFTTLIGGTGYIVFDRLFLGIGLVLDLGTLIYTLYDMYHGSKSKVASKLRETAEKLQEEQTVWVQIFQPSG